jgi:hypothetical protein
MNEAYKKEEKEEKKTLQEEKRRCPECGTENELEAKFCEECGCDLLGTRRCPRCGATLLENADICEACGEWLLEGQCKFCYAPLEEGAKFCAECGNPVDGVECPQCHNISYFDFCKYCNIPLTEQAIQTIENLRNSDKLRKLIEVVEREQEPTNTSLEQIELEKIKEYERKFKQPETKRRIFALFSEEETLKLDDRIQLVQQKGESQQERVKNMAPDVLDKIQQKKFTNNQEARRFSGALKVLLPTIVKKKVPLGWVCNICHVFHPDGPQGCAVAYGGGKWMYDETEEKVIREVEI